VLTEDFLTCPPEIAKIRGLSVFSGEFFDPFPQGLKRRGEGFEPAEAAAAMKPQQRKSVLLLHSEHLY